VLLALFAVVLAIALIASAEPEEDYGDGSTSRLPHYHPHIGPSACSFARRRLRGSNGGGGTASSSAPPPPTAAAENAAWWTERYYDAFVHVTTTSVDRLPLARASRAWRHGLRSVVALETPTPPPAVAHDACAHNERLVSFPDAENVPDGSVPHHKRSDRRSALMPALAADALALDGEAWDWMLVGDDDTVFFLEGARRLVRW
jgi:hypothetical protein